MNDDLTPTNLRSADEEQTKNGERAKRDPRVAARLAAIDAAKAKSPGDRMWWFETMEGDLIVVASPDEDATDEFMSKAQTTKGRGHEHMKFLVRQCLRHPDEAGFAALLKRFPGLSVSIGTDLLKIGGGEAPDLLKKA